MEWTDLSRSGRDGPQGIDQGPRVGRQRPHRWAWRRERRAVRYPPGSGAYSRAGALCLASAFPLSARTPAFSWPTATAPQPDLQSAPRDSRVCSPLTNCHAPHGRRSRSGSRPRCGSPARRLRESQQMDSASRGGCRLAARQTVRASLFSRPPRRRGGAGSMASCSTPATCCGNLSRARATVQFTIRCTKSSLTDGAWS